jgi:hypothetical protein
MEGQRSDSGAERYARYAVRLFWVAEGHSFFGFVYIQGRIHNLLQSLNQQTNTEL